ncbi:sterol desaturase family protein [Actinospongicola halichondriae]|uniref:sterol desaturase family protein n=1 Tax=Actinospongicola halichondriae TaxID=3236844 RepID=UPI003D4534F4
MIGAVGVAVVAFVVMEPVTYLAHRFVFHGAGMFLHRSHHRRWSAPRDTDGRFEANDVFPLIFASTTMVALAVGFNVDGWSVLLPICVGVTAYGAAYAYVHDVYIHGRLGARRARRSLDRLAVAHSLHHRYGGEPYGMLFPVVPRSLRERASQRIDVAPRP